MEKTQKTLRFLSDQNEIASEQNLPPVNLHNSLQDLDQEVQQINAQNNIQIKYYEQYKRIYSLSYNNCCQILKLRKINQQLSSRINIIEVEFSNSHKTKRNEEELDFLEYGEKDQKIKSNKRARRSAEQIQRKYACTAKKCDRCYGSEGSLQQHIELKHSKIQNKSSQSQQL